MEKYTQGMEKDYFEIAEYRMEKMECLRMIFLGSAKSPFFDREKQKTIWFVHHIFMHEGRFLKLRGDNQLDKKLEDLPPIAQSLAGVEVWILYGGETQQQRKNGEGSYKLHEWRVRTVTPWVTNDRPDGNDAPPPGLPF